MMSPQARTNGAPWPSSSGELESLYLELLKRYYEEGDAEWGLAVASRLDEALSSSPVYAHSIRGEEVRSILAELRGDLPAAISSREAEIRKILELHAIAANTESWKYVSKQYDHADVSDRLDLLAILYDKHGDQDRARAVLIESKNYCESHGIPFDAQDLLDELEQAQATVVDEESPRRKPRPRAAIAAGRGPARRRG